MSEALSRRGVLGSGLALAACGPKPAPAAPVAVPPLKAVAPFPVGSEIEVAQLDEPAAVALILRNFSQVTPNIELKMEKILREDGSFDFSGGDRIADFARANRLRLHGHNLIWYTYRPDAFARVTDPAAFARAYANYITAVAGRYSGRCVGWDVVNEPVAEDGEGYRDCLWRERFGMDYVARAFHLAREADPHAILFLNEYNLESLPKKRATFMRLVEGLLKRGVPLQGIGTQTHLSYDQSPEILAPAIRELARFGLPIHVSELDVTTRGKRLDVTPAPERLRRQAVLVGAAAEAFAALPHAQQYAFSTWGVRDRDSWLTKPELKGDRSDRPLLFDDAGRPKPAAAAFVRAVGRGRG